MAVFLGLKQSILVGLFVVVLSACSSHGVPVAPDEIRFTERALQLARNKFPDRDFEVSDGLMLKTRDEQISLRNLYLYVTANKFSGEAEDKAITDFLSSLKFLRQQALQKSWTEAKPSTRLQLIHRDVSKHLGDGAIRRPCEFDSTLRVTVVVDYPQNYLYVNGKDMERWNVDQRILVREAEANLWERSKSLQLNSEAADKGKFLVIEPKDGYAAARIAIPQFRERLRKTLGDPYFFAIPTKNTLLCWSADYSGASDLPADVRDSYQTRPQSLSPHIYRDSNDTIEEVE